MISKQVLLKQVKDVRLVVEYEYTGDDKVATFFVVYVKEQEIRFTDLSDAWSEFVWFIDGNEVAE